MSGGIALRILQFLILPGVLLQPLASEAASEKEVNQAISKLKQEGFFRRISCMEFANFALKRSGLPALGSSAKTQSGFRRFSLDRSKANFKLPDFSDGIAFLNSTQSDEVSLRIIAQPVVDSPTWWQVVLAREWKSGSKLMASKTRYVFTTKLIGEASASCSLLTLEYTASVNGSSAPPIIIDGPECIKVSGAKKARPQNNSFNVRDPNKYLEYDCATAAPFFLTFQAPSELNK